MEGQTESPPDKLQRAPFESALHHAGNGRFQRLLLCACGAVYAACALSTTTLSFVLPSAECDFSLSSEDKGKLNATPLIGMCLGSYLWGNLADARGRKWAIVSALLLDAAAALVSSLAQSFPFFLVCRFFSGFGIIGATGLIFPYFGDFLSLRHRDVMLCRLEVFWTLGTILLPMIAFGVIPTPIFNLTGMESGAGGDAFQFTSWRMFVALCGAPSLLVAGTLACFPESPRYLLHANRADDALAVLRGIFVANTRQPPEAFPVESMVSGGGEDGADEEVVSADDNANVNKTSPPAAPLTWAQRRANFWRRKKTLTTKPYVGMLALCCFVDFGLMFSYYTLMMWFPDLFERFSQYGDSGDAGVCEVSSSLADKLKNITDFKCEQSVNKKVYLYTLVIGLSCLPTSIGVGLSINKVGKKIMLATMLVSSGLAALGLNFVHSSLQNLVLSCVFEAIISCTEAVLFCVICEIFPTNVAATAMAVTVTCGRVGAIVGNVMFGALVDQNCRIPIYIFGGLLVSSGLLCLVLPKTTRPERQT